MRGEEPSVCPSEWRGALAGYETAVCSADARIQASGVPLHAVCLVPLNSRRANGSHYGRLSAQ